MGVSLSWIACKTEFSKAEITQLQNWLQSERKREAEQSARFMTGRAPMAGMRPSIPEPEIVSEQKLPSGWWLVVLERCDVIAAADKLLCSMSVTNKSEIIANFVEEHVMYSHTASYQNGKRVWRVIHDSNKDSMNIEVEGTPPPQFKTIEAEHRKANEQDGNMFDVPVKLAQSIVGYHYGRPVRHIRFF